jgi:hypothetical protein
MMIVEESSLRILIRSAYASMIKQQILEERMKHSLVQLNINMLSFCTSELNILKNLKLIQLSLKTELRVSMTEQRKIALHAYDERDKEVT